MKRGMIIIFTFLILLTAASCATSGKATIAQQRAGLLMLEGEHIYKNKGFYNSKKSYKRRKRNMRAAKKFYRRQ
ncbi:MAG: hypothetical protein ABFS28_05155 [Bacteroidota bacterium]